MANLEIFCKSINSPDSEKEYISQSKTLDLLLRRNFGITLDSKELWKTYEKGALELTFNILHKEGYVVVEPHPSVRDYEMHMQEIKEKYSKEGKKILRYFVDSENMVAGFSWRKK